MKTTKVHSACECQARLSAEIDEQGIVLRGWAKDVRRNQELTAPANTVTRPDKKSFDVGWACPFCTRNVLRSFAA